MKNALAFIGKGYVIIILPSYLFRGTVVYCFKQISCARSLFASTYKGERMKGLHAVLVALVTAVFVSSAEVAVSGSAAVEVTKKCSDATQANIDKGFVRGELKVRGNVESGLSGVIHLRTEPLVGSGMSSVSLQPRQIYFKLPLWMVEVAAGRWYEVYSAGTNYFGRYLYGVNSNGSGNMNTNYTPVDGAKVTVNFLPIKSALRLAFLPKSYNMEDAAFMAMFGGSPVENLLFNVGGNFQVITPASVTAVNRAVVNGNYTIVKDWDLGVFLECAVVDFEAASDNTWFLAGVTSKVEPVFDRVQVELEIKNHRIGGSIDGNLAWMVLLQKTFMGLTFDLNVGADPVVLGSRTAGDVGAIFRTTASF